MSAGSAAYPSRFGSIRIDWEDGAIVRIQAPAGDDPEAGTPTPLTDAVFRQLSEYFDGVRQTFDFPRVLRGTAFEQAVWAALQTIPYGETRTYRDIAAQIGRPAAARAVGAANRKNPILIAVPCHRVVGSDGSPRGYAGGRAMKQELLHLEQNMSADGF